MTAVYLAKGDCLRLMSEIAAASVDMVLCDLPYGITECQVGPQDRCVAAVGRV